MVELTSMEEFESAIDIERTAFDLCNGWLSTENTIRYRGMDWLPPTMYTFGLVHYLIMLHAHLFQHINKKWKVSEEMAEKLASEFVDRIAQFEAIDEDKFRRDAQRLKDAVKWITIDLGSSSSLESVKEILSNKIYNIITESWGAMRRDLIEYVVDAELRRFREIESGLDGVRG